MKFPWKSSFQNEMIECISDSHCKHIEFHVRVVYLIKLQLQFSLLGKLKLSNIFWHSN